jgi:hypothetical protein
LGALEDEEMKVIVILIALLALGFGLPACSQMPDLEKVLPEEIATSLAEQGGVYVILALSITADQALAEQLSAAGIELFDPQGDNRYLAYIPARSVGTLATLLADESIRSVSLIEPATKIRGEFGDPEEAYPIIVHFYQAPTSEQVAQLGSAMTIWNTATGVMNFAEGQATGGQIEAIARLPFVKWVEAAVISTGGGGGE